jgi:hypothetical protein
LDKSTFSVAVEAFAAFGIPVGFLSAFMAFLRWSRGETPNRISEGLNIGVAVGFLPGTILAAVVFIVGLTND